MNRRTAYFILVIIALAAAVWMAFRSASSERTRLVPAWLLTYESGYSARRMVDPFVSWAPDSKNLVFSAANYAGGGPRIFIWSVGGDKLQELTNGLAASYTADGDAFYYFSQEPKTVMKYDVRSGKQTEVLQDIKRSDFWAETKAVYYDPQRETVALRLAEFTPHPSTGIEEYDLDGKLLGDVEERGGRGVVAYSSETDGSRTALIIEEIGGRATTLQIAEGDNDRGKIMDSGIIGAVDWSPKADLVAYGKSYAVIVARPGQTRKITVGRFPPPQGKPDRRFVSRLAWSPDGSYLAVMVYVPNESGDYPLIYVLDMSDFNFDR